MISDNNVFRKIGLGLAAATEAVVYCMSGFAAGYFLDRWIRTSPWLTVLLTLAGLVAGFYRLYRIFSRDEQNDNDGPA